MASKINELRQKRATLVAQANAAMETARTAAAAESRGYSAEEIAAQDDFDRKLAALDTDISMEERKLERERKYGSAAPAATNEPAVPGSGVQPGADRSEADPRKGFRSHTEFLVAVMANSGLRDRADADEKLRPLAVFDKEDNRAGGELAFMLPDAFTPRSLLAAAGSDEQGSYDDRYGGFAGNTRSIHPGILQLGAEADPTTGRTQPIPMTSVTVDIMARTDKDHTSSVSGGFTVTRKPEAVPPGSSRMQLEMVSLKASSLFGLAYATEELLTDSPISFAAIIAAGFSAQFAHQMLSEKIRGAGGSEYLGVLNSPAKVKVDAEAGQAAATIVAQNALKMRARCWGYTDAIWLANHGTFPQLAVMSIAVGVGGTLIYQQSMVPDRPDMLLGRPIFYSEYPSALGTEGDLMLVNWSQYLEGLYQPLQSAESVHVRFVNHERTFKTWLRNAGAPWWRSALTPHKGADTLSPIVTLATRP